MHKTVNINMMLAVFYCLKNMACSIDLSLRIKKFLHRFYGWKHGIVIVHM